MKAVLRTKFIAVNTHTRKTDQVHRNNLMVKLKLLEKDQTKPKACIGKEIINSRAEIITLEITK